MRDMPLDFYGMLFGTDKSSLGADYLRHYGAALAAFRSLSFNLIEIGVFDGASLKMWKSFFPNAQIIGIDIQDRCKIYEENRITVEIGSQADPEFLTRIAAKYPPLIVIDDGSHIAEHIIISWRTLFQHVLPGGCYIIEDLYFHEGATAERNRGDAPMGAQDYILTYARQLMDTHIHPLHAGDLGEELHGSIDRIEAFRGAAIIWKKPAVATSPDYKMLELIADRSGLPKSWYLLASHILNTGGPLDMAERVARKAMESNPTDVGYLDVLSSVLERAQKNVEAVEILRAAQSIAPDHLAKKLGERRERVERAISGR